MDCSAINAFVCNTEPLFQIAGPEGADFAKQRAEIENGLSVLYVQHNAIWDEFVESRGTA